MLTDRQIQAAIRTATTEETLNDGARSRGEGSLRLRIRPGKRGTTATWLAWWQANGKPRTLVIGQYPAISLVDARGMVGKVIGDVKNPSAAIVAPELRTLKMLFDGYVAGMRQDGKSSAEDVDQALTRALRVLDAAQAASDTTAGDISRLLKTIYDRGSPVAADRMRAYISAAFNWGIEAENDYKAKIRQNWGIKTNPAAMVKRDTTAAKTRERNLTADELRTLWYGVDGDGFADGTGAAIRLLLCCGQRILETMRIEGKEIDLDGALWTMPAAKTKGRKKQHIVPLPSLAIPILRALIAKHGSGPLFPPRRGESLTQLGTSLNKAMRRWSRDIKMPYFQGRDLRRTWKSRTADAGIDRFTRDLIQQHAKGDTGSKHYDRADYLPQMREAMMKWNDWLNLNVVSAQHIAIAA